MTGIEMIAAERRRQVEVEGFGPEHDAEHGDGELRKAAICYVFANSLKFPETAPLNEIFWPWSPEWWKPSSDPIRNLAKAGALLAAEIDRLKAKGGA